MAWGQVCCVNCGDRRIRVPVRRRGGCRLDVASSGVGIKWEKSRNSRWAYMFGSRCRKPADSFVPRPLCRDATARLPTRHQKGENGTGKRETDASGTGTQAGRRVDTRLAGSYDQNHGREAHKLKLLCKGDADNVLTSDACRSSSAPQSRTAEHGRHSTCNCALARFACLGLLRRPDVHVLSTFDCMDMPGPSLWLLTASAVHMCSNRLGLLLHTRVNKWCERS